MRMTHTESGVLGHLGQLHPVVSEVVHQDHQRSDPDNMAWSQTSEGVTTAPDLNICVVQLSVRRARVARWWMNISHQSCSSSFTTITRPGMQTLFRGRY